MKRVLMRLARRSKDKLKIKQEIVEKDVIKQLPSWQNMQGTLNGSHTKANRRQIIREFGKQFNR